jgi:hypothetical protein
VRNVQHDQPTVVYEFVEAVLALSDDPGHANLQRYLAASQELEESRRPQDERRARGRGRRPAGVEAAKAEV